MNLQRIQALLNASKVSIPQVSKVTGVGVRSLFRIKAGATNINLSTLQKLQGWAKGRRLPTDKESAEV